MKRAPASRLSSHFWIRHALFPLLLLLVLAILFEVTELDRRTADAWFDFEARVWPNKHSFWAEGVLHDGGRAAVSLVAGAALLVWAGSWRIPRFRPWRRQALFLALTILLSVGAVGLIKTLSNRHCPWDLQRYNGTVPWTRFFEPLPPQVRPGHCFPSAHAATGFSLLGLYFLFLDRDRRRALLGLGIGLATGCLFSFAQLVRGAHFLSHDLWSAAICWTVALVLYRVVYRARNSSA